MARGYPVGKVEVVSDGLLKRTMVYRDRQRYRYAEASEAAQTKIDAS